MGWQEESYSHTNLCYTKGATPVTHLPLGGEGASGMERGFHGERGGAVPPEKKKNGEEVLLGRREVVGGK